MIKTFRSKDLQKLWAGERSKIDKRFQERILRRLDALEIAKVAEDMNLPGWDFHTLHGKPTRYTVHDTVHVNGPWCITFEFEDGTAYRVDFEQYH